MKTQRQVAQQSSQQAAKIAMISPLAFVTSARKDLENCFETTLAEINTVLEQKDLKDEPGKEECNLRASIPSCYHQYLDVFSEVESEKLPPHRENVDVRIDVEDAPKRKIAHSPTAPFTK